MTVLSRPTPGPTISLESANELAELQTRVDRKYIVDDATLTQMRDALPSSYHQLCIDGETEFNYSSIYFDTPGLLTYHAAAYRRRKRFKVRTRTYEESATCMLEVKTKGSRGATVKTRSPYAVATADRLTDEACRFVDGTTGLEGAASEMRPVLTVRYARSTLVDVDSRSRLTIDRALRCVNLVEGMAELDGIIVETKSNGRPSRADRWLWAHGIRPLKVSKFGIGLALTQPSLPANRWHRAMQHGWRVEHDR